MVEYAVLLSLIALALVGPVLGLGQQVGNRFQSITNTLSNGGGGTTLPPTTTTPPPTTSPTTSPNPETGGSGGGGDQKWDGDHDDLSLPAYAVYSAEDKSLEFFRDKDDMPYVGERSRTGKLVSVIYTDFENTLSPDMKSLWAGTSIEPEDRFKSVRFVDRIRPRSMNSWFSGLSYYWGDSPSESPTLLSADLTKLDTSCCSSFENLFGQQYNLSEIKGLEGLDTSRLTSTEYMFLDCKNLVTLDGLSNWDMRNVKTARMMFERCTNLTSVGDISSWKLSSLTSVESMFSGCGKLQADCSKWVTPTTISTKNFNQWAPGVKPPASWS